MVGGGGEVVGRATVRQFCRSCDWRGVRMLGGGSALSCSCAIITADCHALAPWFCCPAVFRQTPFPLTHNPNDVCQARYRSRPYKVGTLFPCSGIEIEGVRECGPRGVHSTEDGGRMGKSDR